jgi:MFS family permease
VLDLAFGAVRGVLADPAVRRIFAIFGVAFLASQMARPYVPLLVEGVVRPGQALTSSIALVAGTAALVGALVSPLGGALGDRIGFRPVLVAALLGGGVALGVMPAAPDVGTLALVALALAACSAAVSAMVFGLLATEIPPERRSATLNLVYLPLYAAGIVGPAMGSLVASAAGLPGPFIAGALVLGAGALVVAVRGGAARSAGPLQAPAAVGSTTPWRREGDASAGDPADD